MKKKFLIALLGSVAAVSCAFGLAACDENGKINKDKADVNSGVTGEINGGSSTVDVTSAYATATELGYTGTLEEFIDNLRGTDGVNGINGIDGKDGVGIKNIERGDDGKIVVTLTDGRTVSFAVSASCAHKFGETEIYEATCTSIGYELRECKVCGYKDYVFIPAIGHKWDDGIALIEPDCTGSGLMLYACNDCRTNKTDVIAPTGHEFIDGVCKNCGITEFSEGLEFTLAENGAGYVLSGIGTCTETDLRIPETYNGLPVVKIGRLAFYRNATLKSVKLAKGVEEIGERAFGYCENIESFTVNDGIKKLGKMFLEGNKKIKYNVSENLCYLGNESNPYLMLMDVADESLETYNINSNTKILYDGAFQWCTSLKYVKIPDGVSYIGSVFGYCSSLKELHIPASVTYIEGGINQSYHLEKLSVDKNNSVYYEKSGCIIERATKTIIQGCNTSVIPDDGSVTAIDDWAFYTIRSANFVNLVIPESITSIGKGAFDMCRDLESVTLPKNLTYLGDFAFRHCDKLKSIEIPAEITEIGTQTFMDCTGLKSIILSNGITTIKDGAFVNCESLEAVFYKGTHEEWEKIILNNYYADIMFESATVYFYSETHPEHDGHHVNDK